MAAEVPKDTVFANADMAIGDFKFDQTIASVFDDMVDRSVPYYQEMQRMTSELAADFAVPGTNLYDLGCATGTTLCVLDKCVDPGVRFIGIDNSEEMLGKAQDKLQAIGIARPYEFINSDLNYCPRLENASVVVMILTLQFVRPLYRESILRQIQEGLNKNGCLILIEKIIQADSMLNRLFIKHYYEFKRRNGYSDVEIALKREALENVLIPYRYEENYKLLQEVGFSQVEEFFRWYNFCCMVAVK